jgi:GT2 family glycosyltransferase
MASRTTGLVSVIVPVFNGERFLHEALDSALAQTYEPVEVVVVDDGSIDGTPEILAGYGDRIRVVRQENRGLSAARNAGLAASSGEFVQFLDADDLLPEDKIARQVEYLAEHPETGVVYCEGRYFCEARPASRLTPGGRWITDGDILSSLTERNFIIVHSALVRRACLEEASGFREDLLSCEDLDMWLRLARHGVRFGFVPDMWVACRIHPDNMSADRTGMLRTHALVLDSVWRDQEDCASTDAREIARHLSNSWYDYGAALMTAGRPREGRRAMRRSLAVGPDPARAAGMRLHILLSYFLPGEVCRLVIAGLHQFHLALATLAGRRPVGNVTCQGFRAHSPACTECLGKRPGIPRGSARAW